MRENERRLKSSGFGFYDPQGIGGGKQGFIRHDRDFHALSNLF